ncbi:MAG: hypothetical protein HQK53_03935 [Oligoflexia bacterium]|nr:hypothetical protein [Oligoflexia bacterium]
MIKKFFFPFLSCYLFFNLALLPLLPLQSAKAVSDPSSRIGGLTDEEYNLKDNFENKGWLSRQSQDACKKEGTGKDGDFSCDKIDVVGFGKEADIYVDTAAKALSTMQMMFGMMGMMTSGGSTSTGGAAAGTAQAQQATCPSWMMACGMLAQAADTIAQSTQKVEAQNLQARQAAGQQTPGAAAASGTGTSTGYKERDKQIDAFDGMISAYKNRIITAGIQSGGWFASAACFGSALWSVGISAGAFCAIKGGLGLASSATLGTFYTLKAKNAADRAELVKNIKEKFAKDTYGKSCNPITERVCYCAQPETEKDVKYCVPTEYQERADGVAEVVSCVDSSMREDPRCSCLATNSCVDAVFKNFPEGISIGGMGVAGPDIRTIAPVFRGKYDAGKLFKDSSAMQAAVKRFMAQRSPPATGAGPLSQKQQKIAKVAEDMGIPPAWAKLLASQPDNPNQAAAASKLRADGINFSGALTDDQLNNLAMGARSAGGGNDRVITFGGGGSRDSGRKGGSDSSNLDYAEMMRKLKGDKDKKGNEDDGKVMRFDDKYQAAMKAAQINKNPSEGLFKILSRRYRDSTWKNFGVGP